MCKESTSGNHQDYPGYAIQKRKQKEGGGFNQPRWSARANRSEMNETVQSSQIGRNGTSVSRRRRGILARLSSCEPPPEKERRKVPRVICPLGPKNVVDMENRSHQFIACSSHFCELLLGNETEMFCLQQQISFLFLFFVRLPANRSHPNCLVPFSLFFFFLDVLYTASAK